MEHERVPVRILEERHVANTGVADLAEELDAGFLEPRALGRHVMNPESDVRDVRLELLSEAGRIDQVERDVARFELGPAFLEIRRVDTQRLAVERLRPLHVLPRHRHEVGPFNHPTEPSIWSWISRFISTAYSSGSSFVIGSTKPETTTADAPASDRPRDIR